jgi:hypothetical protein
MQVSSAHIGRWIFAISSIAILQVDVLYYILQVQFFFGFITFSDHIMVLRYVKPFISEGNLFEF